MKMEHRNRLNLEPPLILALTKIRPRIEVLACHKQAQSSHYHVKTTLIIYKILTKLTLWLTEQPQLVGEVSANFCG
jgi:hypothetical protein